MNCLEFRRAVGAEPFATDPAIEQHAAGCATCARHRDELRAMDAVLARAMRVELEGRERPAAPGDGGREAPVPAPRTSHRWMAMAASLVAGILVAATLWLSYPEPSLAREVIGHAMHEPASWTAGEAVAGERLDQVLGPNEVRLRPEAGTVTYAKRCFFEGHWVAHLVVQTAQGPVTVLMLAHRDVASATRVEEQGLAGVVLPAPRGSIAVVGRDVPDLGAIPEQVFQAIDWDA